MKTSNLTTVGYAYGVPEAAMASALLESSGILVCKHPWHTLSMRWDLTHALGGIEIQVPASQAEQAIAILAEFEPARQPRNRVLLLFAGVIVLMVANVPPPASGFFPAALRPNAARTANPAP